MTSKPLRPTRDIYLFVTTAYERLVAQPDWQHSLTEVFGSLGPNDDFADLADDQLLGVLKIIELTEVQLAYKRGYNESAKDGAKHRKTEIIPS